MLAQFADIDHLRADAHSTEALIEAAGTIGFESPHHHALKALLVKSGCDLADQRPSGSALLMRGEIAEQPPEIIVSSRESGLRPPLLARMR